MNNVFILMGPTASGKSDLAMKLMSKFPFEIINADLYSIYKGLNIGTAKPTKEELNKYKHHLINILEPTMDYNVSQYCKDANKCINEIMIYHYDLYRITKPAELNDKGSMII